MAIENSPYILILLMINRNKRKEKHMICFYVKKKKN